MTSRERILAAIRHERPDRPPCDFWAEPPAWNRLLAHVGHTDRDRLLADLGVDVRHVQAVPPPDRQVGPGLFQNFWGERFVLRPTSWGPMREDGKGALAGEIRFCDLQSFDWPAPDCLDRSHLAEQCRRYDEHAILYGLADVWQRPALVRGWEDFFLDMTQRPDWVHFLCRKFTDFYLEDYTQAAKATGSRIDLYLIFSDVGSQHGPLISQEMFAEFVAPYLKGLIDRIHEIGGRALYHSCGLIRPFIPQLIRLGVDVLDPIQPVGETMQPESLRDAFAGKICFHGGIDTQRLLPDAAPEQVEAEARRYCRVLGRDGGYILGPAHLFQPDVPPENILAVYRAVL